MPDSTDLQLADLQLAVDNAAAFWIGMAESRGHTLIRRPGFLVAGRDGRIGTRVLILRPDLSADDRAELAEAVAGPSAGPVSVEDAYNVVDLADAGFAARQLPVMIRRPGPAPSPSTMAVTRVTVPDQLAIAEQVMVDGFPIESVQPYVRGEVFPASVLAWPGFEFFLISYENQIAGGCVLVRANGVAGLYWVTTLPRFRSRGIGRELMHAVLDHVIGDPVTLTAARAGKPLYDSLDFETIGPATWWSRLT